MNALQDSSVIPVVPNDRRLATFDPNPEMVSIWYEQSAGGPIYVSIGKAADDEQLSRAANKFGLSLNGLVSLRDIQNNVNSVRVTFWFVCDDAGSAPLSPFFDSSLKAEAALESIKLEYPNSHICEASRFFNGSRSGDPEKLAALISSFH